MAMQAETRTGPPQDPYNNEPLVSPRGEAVVGDDDQLHGESLARETVPARSFEVQFLCHRPGAVWTVWAAPGPGPGARARQKSTSVRRDIFVRTVSGKRGLVGKRKEAPKAPLWRSQGRLFAQHKVRGNVDRPIAGAGAGTWSTGLAGGGEGGEGGEGVSLPGGSGQGTWSGWTRGGSLRARDLGSHVL